MDIHKWLMRTFGRDIADLIEGFLHKKPHLPDFLDYNKRGIFGGEKYAQPPLDYSFCYHVMDNGYWQYYGDRKYKRIYSGQ